MSPLLLAASVFLLAFVLLLLGWLLHNRHKLALVYAARILRRHTPPAVEETP